MKLLNFALRGVWSPTRDNVEHAHDDHQAFHVNGLAPRCYALKPTLTQGREHKLAFAK